MDDRDICERLEDPSYDGAIYMRQDAAKEIRALRARVQEQEEWNSLRAMDIVTLGLEVGRLWEALEKCRPLLCRAHDRIHALPRATDTELANEIDAALGNIRAALAGKEEK